MHILKYINNTTCNNNFVWNNCCKKFFFRSWNCGKKIVCGFHLNFFLFYFYFFFILFFFFSRGKYSKYNKNVITHKNSLSSIYRHFYLHPPPTIQITININGSVAVALAIARNNICKCNIIFSRERIWYCDAI